ncbi:MAG: sugar phosphate isomerase/epimerase, partial [Chloroflexia bacterium]
LAALHARSIRLLEEDWWESFPPCDVRRVLPVLRLAAERGRPQGEDWRTPLERGGPIEEVAAYELAQFVESVRYLRSLAE